MVGFDITGTFSHTHYIVRISLSDAQYLAIALLPTLALSVLSHLQHGLVLYDRLLVRQTTTTPFHALAEFVTFFYKRTLGRNKSQAPTFHKPTGSQHY
jgi:hypothetical protein